MDYKRTPIADSFESAKVAKYAINEMARGWALGRSSLVRISEAYFPRIIIRKVSNRVLKLETARQEGPEITPTETRLTQHLLFSREGVG